MSAKLKKLRTAVTLPARHPKYAKCEPPKQKKRKRQNKEQVSRNTNQDFCINKSFVFRLQNFRKEQTENEHKT